MVKLKRIIINKQNRKRALELGYPIDIIWNKKMPKTAIKIHSTNHFIRYAFGNKNLLIPKKGYKLVYG